MTVKTEPVHNAEFMVSEGNNSISRDTVQLGPNLMLLPGTVLGKTSDDLYVPFDPAASDGSETAVAALLHKAVTNEVNGVAVVISRMAEVVSSLLVWGDVVTQEQKDTALASLATKNIIARD